MVVFFICMDKIIDGQGRTFTRFSFATGASCVGGPSSQPDSSSHPNSEEQTQEQDGRNDRGLVAATSKDVGIQVTQIVTFVIMKHSIIIAAVCYLKFHILLCANLVKKNKH